MRWSRRRNAPVAVDQPEPMADEAMMEAINKLEKALAEAKVMFRHRPPPDFREHA